MPRQARQASSTGIYHVIVRGINRQDIFHEDDDRERYLMTLKRIALESQSEVMGYCLMDNHAHLLIKEGASGISLLMKRLGASYAYWYNLKYDHAGHVFQDRFKSENVEDEPYLVTVLRYIHRNPVKAGIASKPEDYRWSSARNYYTSDTNMVNSEFILSLFADDVQAAKEIMRKHEAEENEDVCLEEIERKLLSSEQATLIIQDKMCGKPIGSLQKMNIEEKNQILRELKAVNGLSIRQIARITGLTVYQVHNA